MMNSSGYVQPLFNHELMKKENIDEMEYQDAKSETSSITSNSTQRAHHGKAKVFQCTGYGECRMVFTRSEHLARHMRKHTGEKPFKCVVPGCERMFSRFDNMMQHTQTHNKNKGQKRNKMVTTTTTTKSKRGRKSVSMTRKQQENILPSPPISRRNSSLSMGHLSKQIILPQPVIHHDYFHHHHSALPPPPPPPPNYQEEYYFPYKRFPDSPSSSPELYEPLRRRSAPQIRYHPYPAHKYQPLEHQEVLPLMRRHSILSQLATYLVDHPDKSPESYLEYKKEPPRLPTRRLSIQDLSNPIEELEQDRKVQEEEEGVDLTEDEYQAIQGFGQFYRTAIHCNKIN